MNDVEKWAKDKEELGELIELLRFETKERQLEILDERAEKRKLTQDMK